MFPLEFGMKKVNVGSGGVIGNDNIEEFPTFASKLFAHEKRSIVELTHNYDSAISCLVNRLDHRLLTQYCSKCSLNLIAWREGKKKIMC